MLLIAKFELFLENFEQPLQQAILRETKGLRGP